MARVLVAERIASAGLDVLRDAGHRVDVRLGMSPEDLLSEVEGAQALIIRSATQVTAEVVEAGKALVVVGRAGVGLDNVDLAAATSLGVTVVNAPLSNVLSAAEHTVALILAQARNIPQAHAALVAGRWERAKWEGIELSGKTPGHRRPGPGSGASWPSESPGSPCSPWRTTPTSRPSRPASCASNWSAFPS